MFVRGSLISTDLFSTPASFKKKQHPQSLATE